MKQNEFIKQYQAEHPDAEFPQIQRAWMQLIGSKKGKNTDLNPASIAGFCRAIGKNKNYYHLLKKRNSPKYPALHAQYIEYLKKLTLN